MGNNDPSSTFALCLSLVNIIIIYIKVIMNDAILSTKVNSFPSTTCEQIDEGQGDGSGQLCVDSTPVGEGPLCRPRAAHSLLQAPRHPGRKSCVRRGGLDPRCCPIKVKVSRQTATERQPAPVPGHSRES